MEGGGGDCITGHHIHVADILQHLPPGKCPTHPLGDVISTSIYVHVHATSITHARKGTFLSYSITPTVVGVYRDWPGFSALNLYI